MKIKNFTITNWFNSKYHGVPQNRERVYTLGHLRRYGERKVFPLCGADGEDSVQHKINIIGHRDGYRRNTQTFDYNGITEALDTAADGGREHHTAIPMFGIDKNAQGTELECANALTAREDRGVSNFKQTGTAIAVTVGYDNGLNEITTGAYPTCNARDYKGVNFRDLGAVCIPVLTPERVEKRQNGRRFKDNGEEAFTLTAQDKHGVAISEVNGVPVIWYEKYNCYIAIRKLTPKECFRLQGWTDDYFEKAQFVNSDSQLYKQAGNGVTVNVVEDIARAIGECE